MGPLEKGLRISQMDASAVVTRPSAADTRTADYAKPRATGIAQDTPIKLSLRSIRETAASNSRLQAHRFLDQSSAARRSTSLGVFVGHF